MKNSRRSYKTNPNFLPDKIGKCGCGKKTLLIRVLTIVLSMKRLIMMSNQPPDVSTALKSITWRYAPELVTMS